MSEQSAMVYSERHAQRLRARKIKRYNRVLIGLLIFYPLFAAFMGGLITLTYLSEQSGQTIKTWVQGANCWGALERGDDAYMQANCGVEEL